MVRKIEMSSPQAEKLMKKIETSDMEVGELVKKVQMNESKVRRIGRSSRLGQEECMKREQDTMLAGLARKVNSSIALATSLGRSCPGKL